MRLRKKTQNPPISYTSCRLNPHDQLSRLHVYGIYKRTLRAPIKENTLALIAWSPRPCPPPLIFTSLLGAWRFPAGFSQPGEKSLPKLIGALTRELCCPVLIVSPVFVIPRGLSSWQRGTAIPEMMGSGGDFTYRLCPQESVTPLSPVWLS